jgi:hypothetical protein
MSFLIRELVMQNSGKFPEMSEEYLNRGGGGGLLCNCRETQEFLQASAPDASKLPKDDIVGVTAILLTCLYTNKVPAAQIMPGACISHTFFNFHDCKQRDDTSRPLRG